MAIRLAKNCANPLYETYLTKNFKIDRNSALITFVKRYLVMFNLNVTMREIGDRISVPTLLNVL